MDAKGIETVRRDNCLMVSNVVKECLRLILLERDVGASALRCRTKCALRIDPNRPMPLAGAQEAVRQTIRDLLQNKLDLSLLVISKVVDVAAFVVVGAQSWCGASM